MAKVLLFIGFSLLFFLFFAIAICSAVCRMVEYVKKSAFSLSRNRKTSSVALPYPKAKPTSSQGWCYLILGLNISCLSLCWNFRLFSSERKVACIYVILVRSVLHIYTIGLYIYTFHPFAVTLFPTRVSHPLLTVSTTCSRVPEETPPTVCTRLVARVHTHFLFSACTSCSFA